MTQPLVCVVLFFLLSVIGGFAANTCSPQTDLPLVWPYPTSISLGQSSPLTLTPAILSFNSSISSSILNDGITRTIDYFNSLLTFSFQSSSSPLNSENIANIEIDVASSSDLLGPTTDESYQLQISAPTTYIKSQTIYGALYALTTLQQLASPCTGTNLVYSEWTVDDSPHFPHRGLTLDTARNFYSIPVLKNIIKGLASAKMNVFHWHISDSQSFPVEILTPEISNLTNPAFPWQFYSHSQIINFISYAQSYGVRVIPEFDMPAHTTSWVKGFPDIVLCPAMTPWDLYANEPPAGQLDPSNSKTYQVIDYLVKEMTATFPDQYYHIGGDEVNFECWNTSESFVNWLDENNFSSGDALAYFEQKVTSIVESTGKTVMVWQDAILEGATFANKSNTIVQVWDTNYTVFSQIISEGYDIVISNADQMYLDCGAGNFVDYGISWCDPFKSWLDIYNNSVFYYLTPEEFESVIGGEVALWSEQTDDNNAETMIFPRVFGAAEPFWSGMNPNFNYTTVLERLKVQRQRLVNLGVRAVPLQPAWCLVNGENSCPPT